MLVNIYTDGSSQKEHSGWGFVAVDEKENELVRRGKLMPSSCTNQQMELIGAIMGCTWFNSHYSDSDQIVIYSDSAYIINCYNQQWYNSWQNNGWINSKKQPVANKELWIELIKYFKKPNFTFVKVKGHNGVKFNEIADKIAQGKIMIT